MPLTLEQIVEETRHWPQEKLSQLVDLLSQELNPTEAGHEEAWKQEARRRLMEIETGKVQVVPGDEVSARIRRIVER
jgi:putative addiction module component (TIGR02574 family)